MIEKLNNKLPSALADGTNEAGVPALAKFFFILAKAN